MAKNIRLTNITITKKLVPQRGWKVENFATFSGDRFTLSSKANTVLRRDIQTGVLHLS